MSNITERFTTAYTPIKSFIVFTSQSEKVESYVEAFDFDKKGRMINAHPLTEQESEKLGKILLASNEQQAKCFDSKGLIPANLLFLRAGVNGSAIWHTPARQMSLLFVDDLGLSNGIYPVPALIWKANRESLSVFAIKESKKPTLDTILFEAPFFNIHTSGLVCMGTVDIEIDDEHGVEVFMKQWENYFFNSRFSHLLTGRSPVNSNIIQLYKNLHNSKNPFPQNELLKHTKSFKTLINE